VDDDDSGKFLKVDGAGFGGFVAVVALLAAVLVAHRRAN